MAESPCCSQADVDHTDGLLVGLDQHPDVQQAAETAAAVKRMEEEMEALKQQAAAVSGEN